jgi:DNA-binding TFAR19-related protein (PDSD5 family)
MTIDERIEHLTANQEKTQTMLADIVDTLKRLERIALSHEVRLQDVEGTLTALEGKGRRPQ